MADYLPTNIDDKTLKCLVKKSVPHDADRGVKKKEGMRDVECYLRNLDLLLKFAIFHLHRFSNDRRNNDR
uniref:Uncharacterized protein n=1 Tax=Romanomermis culicivorax TaxID=13658 RepID=A0A915J7L3_ROMCU